MSCHIYVIFFFFQAEDGIRDLTVTGVQTCALPISAQVAGICRKAADGQVVSPANLNSPEQTVISGHAAAVKRAVEMASAGGAKRAVVLAVSAPFHSALMLPAQQRLEIDLRGTAFHPLR